MEYLSTIPADTPTKQDKQRRGFCGVYAVAIMAGTSFARAWRFCARRQKELTGAKRFGGGTMHTSRERALEDLGVKLDRIATPRCALETAVRTLPARVPHMITVTGHVVVVYRGRVYDQSTGPRGTFIGDYAGRRKMVKSVHRKA